MSMSRRQTLAGAAMLGITNLALPAIAGGSFGGTYHLVPEQVAKGIWVVRGADQHIAPANGGAIANCTILASDAGAILVDCGPSLAYGKALGALANRLVGAPVSRVLITHLHPDHALGAAAYPPAMVAALPGTIAGIRSSGEAMADQMYRILADWMRGTEVVIPGQTLAAGPLTLGNRRLTLMALLGHSDSDLVVLDDASGTMITGDLVFHNRAPATPHANLERWLASLALLEKMPHQQLIPGHGAVHDGEAGITQTREWLVWLQNAITGAVDHDITMAEAGEMQIPAPQSGLAQARYEWQRSISHFYPGFEAARLPRIDTGLSKSA